VSAAAKPLRIVLDCSMSVARARRAPALEAVNLLAQATGAPVELHGFPIPARGRVVSRLWGPSEWALDAVDWSPCLRADYALGTPLARALYEAQMHVYRPGDAWRTVVVTDGECTGCGRWLGELARARPWLWRLLVVLVDDPSWLEESKYGSESRALLATLEAAAREAGVEPPLVTLDRLASTPRVSLITLLRPRLSVEL